MQEQRKQNKLPKFKMILLGDQSVGKTAIMKRYINSEFSLESLPTVGIDFVSKKVDIRGSKVRVQMWDSAGQERFRSLIPSYIKDSNLSLLVFDITERNSFNNLKMWLDFIRENSFSDKIVLLCNKIDLAGERAVSDQQIDTLCKNEKIPVRKVSALTGEGVDKLFQDLTGEFIGIPQTPAESTESTLTQKAVKEQVGRGRCC